MIGMTMRKNNEIELAKVDERRVTPQELLALPDPDAEMATVSADSSVGLSPESADPI